MNQITCCRPWGWRRRQCRTEIACGDFRDTCCGLPHVSLALHSRLSLSDGEQVELALCVLAIYVCFIIFGILQEWMYAL